MQEVFDARCFAARGESGTTDQLAQSEACPFAWLVIGCSPTKHEAGISAPAALPRRSRKGV